jgi:hypothetical protein
MRIVFDKNAEKRKVMNVNYFFLPTTIIFPFFKIKKFISFSGFPGFLPQPCGNLVY